jgi:N6-L-threonylcarbamoyladenine synthase
MATIGIDSSNYRSSAAYINDVFEYVSNRKLLPVPSGERGLRQSDAVFAHTKQLPTIVKELIEGIDIKTVKAIGVSDRPRRLQESYMPCFLTGVGLAEVLGAALNLPIFKFSHQEGHIAAALLSANRLDLLNKPFIAFHVSGGTTEALLVSPAEVGFKVEIIAKTLDLHLGQVIDRVGVKLGIDFPCGEELEILALKGKSPKNPKPCIKRFDCALSGAENIAEKMIASGESRENIAAFTIDFAAKTLCEMTLKIKENFPEYSIVYSGGVMANNYIKSELRKITDADFASIELSGDNAVGIALLANLCLEK